MAASDTEIRVAFLCERRERLGRGGVRGRGAGTAAADVTPIVLAGDRLFLFRTTVATEGA